MATHFLYLETLHIKYFCQRPYYQHCLACTKYLCLAWCWKILFFPYVWLHNGEEFTLLCPSCQVQYQSQSNTFLSIITNIILLDGQFFSSIFSQGRTPSLSDLLSEFLIFFVVCTFFWHMIAFYPVTSLV